MLIAEMQGIDGEVAADLPDTLSAYRAGTGRLQQGLDWLLANAGNDLVNAGAAAFNLLMLCGVVAGAHQMLRSALIAKARLASAEETERPFLEAKLTTTRFYIEHILPRSAAYLDAATAGGGSMMELAEEQFEPAAL